MRKIKLNLGIKSISLLFSLLLFFLLISCSSNRMPGLKEVRSAEGDILIQNVPVVNPVNEEVKKGMDILIRSGKINKIQPTGKEKFKNISLVIPGEELYAVPGFVIRNILLIIKKDTNEY